MEKEDVLISTFALIEWKKLGSKAVQEAWSQSYPNPNKMQFWYMEIRKKDLE